MLAAERVKKRGSQATSSRKGVYLVPGRHCAQLKKLCKSRTRVKVYTPGTRSTPFVLALCRRQKASP